MSTHFLWNHISQVSQQIPYWTHVGHSSHTEKYMNFDLQDLGDLNLILRGQIVIWRDNKHQCV